MTRLSHFGVFAFACFLPAAFGSGTAIPYTSFCEITANPEVYDQRTVLTSGIVQLRAFEDPACKPRPKPDSTLPLDRTFTAFDKEIAKNSASKRLNQLLAERKAAFVVVQGKFESHNRYIGQLPDDAEVRNLLEKGNARFGHDNCCRFRLTIQAVKLAEPVGTYQ